MQVNIVIYSVNLFCHLSSIITLAFLFPKDFFFQKNKIITLKNGAPHSSFCTNHFVSMYLLDCCNIETAKRIVTAAVPLHLAVSVAFGTVPIFLLHVIHSTNMASSSQDPGANLWPQEPAQVLRDILEAEHDLSRAVRESGSRRWKLLLISICYGICHGFCLW